MSDLPSDLRELLPVRRGKRKSRHARRNIVRRLLRAELRLDEPAAASPRRRYRYMRRRRPGDLAMFLLGACGLLEKRPR